jgi:hypothetical protein
MILLSSQIAVLLVIIRNSQFWGQKYFINHNIDPNSALAP